MIKVLMIAKAIEKTGITSVMLAYFNHIDRKEIKIDFATGPIYEKKCKEHVEKEGSNFWILPNRDIKLLVYIIKLSKIIKENEYQIVHVHGNSAMIFPELVAAKLGGAKVRIAHSHNTKCNHSKLEFVVRPVFYHFYTHALACSKEAGLWMFKSRPFTIINNGIDVEKYNFSEKERLQVRTEIGLKNQDFIIGHVGYFNYQKNQSRLIDIFEMVHKKKRNSKLLLVGDGGTRAEIEKKIRNKRLTDSVILYGQSNNISRLMSAMDIFVLPSLFEGFGIVILEAQAMGLHCVVSDAVPKVVANAVNAVDFISLNESDETWANVVLQRWDKDLKDRQSISTENKKNIVENSFEIKSIAKILENYYKSAWKETYGNK